MYEEIGEPINSKHSLEEMGNSMTVESFFSTYILLDTLLSTDLIDMAKSLHAATPQRLVREGLRQGYKLLLVNVFHEYINEIVRHPEVIGIEPDLDYHDYWAFTKGRGREITRGAVRTEHVISKFVAKVNTFIKELLTLESWESIETFSEETMGFRDCLKMISEKAYIVSKNNRKVSMRKALLESSIMILWTISCNPLPIAHMYTDYFTRPRDAEPNLHLLDEIVRESQTASGMTRLDFSQFDPTFFPRPLPTHWSLGFAFSLHESLKLLDSNKKQKTRLISLDELVLNTKDWRDIEKYDRKLDHVYGLPKPFRGYSYKSNQIITDNDRQPLISEVGILPSPEKLLSILGNRAKIVERGSPAAFNSFECLLDGAIKRSKRTGELAKVAIIVHKNHWGQEDYSAAIFMPAYGWISNASMWWVFYLIGNNHSGGASHQMRLVVNKISRNRKAFDLIGEIATEVDFYKSCEDPGYTRLNEAIVLTNRITSDVRGAFPELLLANMLTNMGYTKVLNRFKPKILKSVKGELDTVGVIFTGESISHIMLFESKGQANDEDELQQEIDRFSGNVSTIQKKLESFCAELEVTYAQNVEVEAIFVSMAVLDDRNDNNNEEQEHPRLFRFRGPHVNIPENIKLWDYNKLVSMLRKHHVPSKYLELLKSTQVAVNL